MLYGWMRTLPPGIARAMSWTLTIVELYSPKTLASLRSTYNDRLFLLMNCNISSDIGMIILERMDSSSLCPLAKPILPPCMDQLVHCIASLIGLPMDQGVALKRLEC